MSPQLPRPKEQQHVAGPTLLLVPPFGGRGRKGEPAALFFARQAEGGGRLAGPRGPA
jgi:hypothetical protein